MTTSNHAVALHAHGITPVVLDGSSTFANKTVPLDSLSLENDTLWLHYTTLGVEYAVKTDPLLVLVVDDRDPVGASDRLTGWTYGGTFEVSFELRHVWWRFQPPATAAVR